MLKKAAAVVNIGYGMDPKIGKAIQEAADDVGDSILHTWDLIFIYFSEGHIWQVDRALSPGSVSNG